jgi:hypothetical protein
VVAVHGIQRVDQQPPVGVAQAGVTIASKDSRPSYVSFTVSPGIDGGGWMAKWPTYEHLFD